MSLVVKLRNPNVQDYEHDIQTKSAEQHPIFTMFIRPCFAEFLGTMLVTFQSCVVLIANPSDSPTALLAFIESVTTGCSYAALSYCLGHISGGHFNPTLTLAACIGGGIRIALAAFYFICQLLGAFIGALLSRSIVYQTIYDQSQGGMTISDFELANQGQCVLLELILSSIVALVFLMAHVDSQGSNTAAPGLIGISVISTMLCGYAVTGASMSTARSLGTAISLTVFGEVTWRYHYIYWAGPLFGAVVAATIYRFVLARDGHRLMFTN